MIDSSEKNFFSRRILQWYEREKRNLPWRETRDPYKIWLSEIILQQTRVVQGLPYYENFLLHFPTVFDLAYASEDQVFKLWQGLGYYSRAKNLHQTAQKIAFENQGIFPKTHAELLKLKGIGDYTASAIASVCYGQPSAAVDGNVYRVLSRVFGIDTPIDTSEGVSIFKKLASQLIDVKNPGTYNQAIMDFGAMQCKPKSPDCENCIFSDKCWAKANGQVSQLPVKKGKAKVRKRFFNYFILQDPQKRTLLQKRTEKDIWQGLYEFPMIESENAISLMYDYLKKYPYSYSEMTLWNKKPIVHKLSHQHIHAFFWIVNVSQSLEEGIYLSDLQHFPVSILTANFIKEFGF
ncbi:A/G-specific adenine glycosylase [Capnocytophaga canimorsus]|uniref:A/G-specific adenine glycosylase n=1 Tax=Capnocytophaga canimorsus TaxID=28188 RepID=UPI0038591BE8